MSSNTRELPTSCPVSVLLPPRTLPTPSPSPTPLSQDCTKEAHCPGTLASQAPEEGDASASKASLILPLLISGLPGAKGSGTAWGPENGSPPLLSPYDHSRGRLGETVRWWGS